jgi:hypothetical protein
MVRLQPHLAECLDDWRRRQPDLPSRAEALRRLAEQALELYNIANRKKRR